MQRLDDGRSMCLSVQADVVGGLAVSAVGIDVLRHVGKRREYLALAALPLLFGLHQLDEEFVWLGMQGHASPETGRTATWLYLLFAFVLLPIYVPFAVRQIEPSGRLRIAMDAFLVIGVGVSITLLIALRRGPVRAQLALNHLSYTSGHHAGWPIVGAYVVATCGSLVVSRRTFVTNFFRLSLARHLRRLRSSCVRGSVREAFGAGLNDDLVQGSRERERCLIPGRHG